MRLTEEQYVALLGKATKKTNTVITDGYTSNFKGWVEVAPEKNYYFRSIWEVYYAKYLQFLKKKRAISEWLYEPKTFNFPKQRYAAGPFSYKPDFQVIKGDITEWHEVKGWMNPSSKKKLKRFQECFPDEGEVIVIGKDFFTEMRKKGMDNVLGWKKFKAKVR